MGQDDESKVLSCPRDGAELKAQKYEANIEVDVCGQCHGMWLDKGELEAIEKASEHDYSDELKSDKGTSPRSQASAHPAHLQGAIECPKCGGEMEAREYGFASQITIDTCLGGCGVWLDAGEIQGLEKFFERNRGNVTLPLRWRMWASVLSVFKKR